MGLAAFGAYLMAKHAFQYIMLRRRHREFQKRSELLLTNSPSYVHEMNEASVRTCRVLDATSKRSGTDEESMLLVIWVSWLCTKM